MAPCVCTFLYVYVLKAFSLQYLTMLCVFVSYEPELHPAATYRIKHIKATIQVFSTGSITVTGISHLHLHAHSQTLTSLTLLYIQLEGTPA